MIWQWKRHSEAQRPNPTSAGARAHQQASANLASARAKGPEVKRVAASLRELREVNGFVPMLENLFQGGQRP